MISSFAQPSLTTAVHCVCSTVSFNGITIQYIATTILSPTILIVSLATATQSLYFNITAIQFIYSTELKYLLLLHYCPSLLHYCPSLLHYAPRYCIAKD